MGFTKVCDMRKGSEWWCEDARISITEKKHTHEVQLQRKDEVSYERYKEKQNQAKWGLRVIKVSADERWCRKTGNFHTNKMF